LWSRPRPKLGCGAKERRRRRRRRIQHTWQRGDVHTVFWLENLKGREHTEEPGTDGKIILEWILGKQDGKVWTGYIWLRIGTNGRFL
jgi:hypothetical protein